MFETLKDGSPQSISLASNNCFSYTDVFQNGVNALSKMVNLFFFFFLLKSSKFCVVQTIRFCSNFTSMLSKYLSNNVWRDLNGHWTSIIQYNIYLFVPSSTKNFKINQYRNFQLIWSTRFHFMRLFCD